MADFYKKRGRIYAESGYSVAYGRDWLVYRHGEKRMTITADTGGFSITLFAETATRWDDNLSTSVDEGTTLQILNNVKQALEWGGLEVRILP